MRAYLCVCPSRAVLLPRCSAAARTYSVVISTSEEEALSPHVWRPGVLLSIVVYSGQRPQQRMMGPEMWVMPRFCKPVLETGVDVAMGSMIG